MRVLVIDDSRAMRSILGQMMTELGFEVVGAPSGDAALQQVSDQGAPDLILLDCNMPGMDGFATLAALRQHPSCGTVPIVMVTTETTLEQVAKALESGASEYVMKPFTKDILAGKLEILGLRAAA